MATSRIGATWKMNFSHHFLVHLFTLLFQKPTRLYSAVSLFFFSFTPLFDGVLHDVSVVVFLKSPMWSLQRLNKNYSYVFLMLSTGTISLNSRLTKKTQYRLKVEARLNDVIFALVTVVIRVYNSKTTPVPRLSDSLKFPSPIYSVIIPKDMLVGQTILHLRVEKGKHLANATIRYEVKSINPYYRSPYFNLHPVTGALKIVRDLSSLGGDDSASSFLLQVFASVQGERNGFASTQVSVVIVSEYAGNDYVALSMETVKNRTSTRGGFERLRFDKVGGQEEFSLHRIFRRPSPAAQRIAAADLKFNNIIREIKRGVAQELLGLLRFQSTALV